MLEIIWFFTIILIVIGIFVTAGVALLLWFLVILPLLALASIIVSPFSSKPILPIDKNICPDCGSPLHPIRSQFIKMCGSCDYQEPWELKPGQKPLITSSRDVRK